MTDTPKPLSNAISPVVFMGSGGPGLTPERYGRVRVGKIRAAYNDLRTAVRSGDIVAANEALDRYEQWADFVFDDRHRSSDATP